MSNPTDLSYFNDSTVIEGLLKQLNSGDTEIIKHAEKAFKQYEKSSSCVSGLLFQMQACQDSACRHQASILLRKKIGKHFETFDLATKQNTKNLLLQLVTSEPEKVIRTATAGVIGALSRVVLPNGGWPELFALLMQLAQGPEPQKKCLCFTILAQMSFYVAEELKPHVATLANIFQSGIQDPSFDVVKESLDATLSFISAIGECDEVMAFQGLLSPMIQVMTLQLQSPTCNEALVLSGLEVLQECAFLEKPLVNEFLEVIVPFTVSILQAQGLDSSVQSSAGQTLMSLIECRPKLIAKKNLVEPILKSLVEIMARTEDTAGTLFNTSRQMASDNADDDEEDEDYEPEESPAAIAQICLDTLAQSIPSKRFAGPAIALCNECFINGDPKIRKAGCALLGVIVEGISDAIRPVLASLVPELLKKVQDPDEKVRETGLFAIGQVSEHCQPEILFHHHLILPVLIAALDDQHSSVHHTCCYGLEMFCENLESSSLKPFLQPLVTKLCALLASKDKTTVDLSLAALAATAISAESDFLPFADHVCTGLTSLISMTEKGYLQIRGRALECLGHIGIAIGRTHFAPHFINGMTSAAEAEGLEDDTLKEYSYVFIANAAKVMGDEFNPHLGSLVPLLLNKAAEQGVSKSPGDEADAAADDDDDDDDDDPLYMDVSDGFVNTKKAALTALGALAEHTGQAYAPFLMSTCEVLLSEDVGTVYSYHKLVRAESVSIMSSLLSVACDEYGYQKPEKGAAAPPMNAHLASLCSSLVSACIKVISSDGERLPVAQGCEQLGEIIEMVGMEGLLVADPSGSGKTLAETLMEKIHICLREKAPCQLKIETADDDEDNHDNLVMDAVCDLIGTIAKYTKQSMATYFETFYPLLLKFTKSSRSHSDRAMAIGCIGEVIGELGPGAMKYVETMLPVAMENLQDAMEGVRRNSAFCIGMFVQSLGKALAPTHFAQILHALYPLCALQVTVSGATNSGGADADNAISTVAHMVRAGLPEHIPLSQVLDVMLAALPLKCDALEADNIYSLLCTLLLDGNPAATRVMPVILQLIAQACMPGQRVDVGDDVKAKLVICIKSLAAGNAPTGADVFMAALRAISNQELLGIIQSIMHS